MAKGMILAAGQGTRVRPLTKDLPKPMIPILGKPLMEYLIEHLASYGIKEIMVNVAFNHHKIEQYFGDGHRWGVQIGYAYEGVREQGEVTPKPFGSAGGMRRIQDFSGFFDETTLVLCGDAIIDLDIGAALQEHKAKGAIASVVTLDVPLSEVQNYGVVVADDNGQIQSFQEKPLPSEAKSTAASTGIYIFEPEVLKLVPPGVVYDIGSQLFPQLVESKAPFFAQKHRPRQRLLGGVATGVARRGGADEHARARDQTRHLGRPEHADSVGPGHHRRAGLHRLQRAHRARRQHHRPKLDRPRLPHPLGRQSGAQHPVRIHPHCG